MVQKSEVYKFVKRRAEGCCTNKSRIEIDKFMFSFEMLDKIKFEKIEQANILLNIYDFLLKRCFIVKLRSSSIKKTYFNFFLLNFSLKTNILQ